MKRRTALVVLAGMVGLAGPAAADETTFCNAFITSLPVTIVQQGHYCFNRNLSTPITSGNAITINVDFVVLDLNNFKLGGGAAGLGTDATGIATDHSNITIRNGNIRGFRRGILITGGTNHVVENNVLDGNTQYGALLDSNTSGVVVRNNLVSNTGGSTLGTYPYGIYTWGVGTATQVRDNVVSNVFSDTSDVVGIWGVRSSTDHNLVRLGSSPGNKFGTAWAYNRDNTVLEASSATDAFYYSYGQIGANFSDP